MLNETVYTVYADPTYVKDASKIAEVIKKVAGGNAVSNFESGLNNKTSRYAVLARQVTKTQADLIEKENLLALGLKKNQNGFIQKVRLLPRRLGLLTARNKGNTA